MLSQLGVHGPNAAWSIPDWYRLGCSSARWVELLSPDHSRQDAELAKSLGLRVLVRAPGEGIVHYEDVQKILTAFSGVVDVIQVGNEPVPNAAYSDWETLLWNHARYLELVNSNCAEEARQAHVQLCAPGWVSPLLPPSTNYTLQNYVVTEALATRLQHVYALFDALAVHCYDPWTLANVNQYVRIGAWQSWFGKRPIYITEAGIAATTLLTANKDRLANDIEKAQRYRDFLSGLPSYVVAAFFFILGGTDDYRLFNGSNSYWLDNRAWQVLGGDVH